MGDIAAVIPLVADPYPATGCPLPTASAKAYAPARAGYPPATAATAATAAPCAPTYCAATCAPTYCAGNCRATCAPTYCAGNCRATCATNRYCAAASASAPGCSTASAPPATATAAATSGSKFYALVELGFVLPVEDIERPQANVGDFFLIESDSRTQ